MTLAMAHRSRRRATEASVTRCRPKGHLIESDKERSDSTKGRCNQWKDCCGHRMMENTRTECYSRGTGATVSVHHIFKK